MSRKYESVDKMIQNVYRFVGRHAGGPGFPRGSVELTTDSQKWSVP